MTQTWRFVKLGVPQRFGCQFWIIALLCSFHLIRKSTSLRAAVLCDLACATSVHRVLIPFELMKVPRGCSFLVLTFWDWYFSGGLFFGLFIHIHIYFQLCRSLKTLSTAALLDINCSIVHSGGRFFIFAFFFVLFCFQIILVKNLRDLVVVLMKEFLLEVCYKEF